MAYSALFLRSLRQASRALRLAAMNAPTTLEKQQLQWQRRFVVDAMCDAIPREVSGTHQS